MSEKRQRKILKNQIVWNNICNCIERKLRKSFRNDFFMRKLLDLSNTQMMMKQMMRQERAFVVIRFGLYEYMLCYQYLEKECGIREKYSDFVRYHISMDAGIFNNDEYSLDEYSRYIFSNLRDVDVVAYWRNIPNIKIFSAFYSDLVEHINMENLYPYPFLHKDSLPNWQLSLKGKRVLVVSSFAESVRKQYLKRKDLWKNSEMILPDFELIPYQAVVTNGGKADARFSGWQDALEFMKYSLLSLNFDIALISCGAYGMPLALELKKNGRKAVQWGGCYQLWFGILGGRWDKEDTIMKYANQNWIYPSKSETPPLAELVNDSCYWKTK